MTSLFNTYHTGKSLLMKGEKRHEIFSQIGSELIIDLTILTQETVQDSTILAYN